MDVAVVGSGVSGIFTAHALAKRDLNVTILDVGERLDEERSAIVRKLHDLRPDQWPQSDYDLIRENSTFGTGDLPKKVHFGSDYIYASNRSFAPLTTMAEGRAPYPTFARGGFSNIWGAAALPPDQCDMADWPVSHAEMEPFFGEVAQLIPLCGGEGTLSHAFPAFKEPIGHIDPGPQGGLLLDDLKRAETRLLASQTLYGPARLAIHTKAEGGALPCIGCGHCFTGCVFGSIFSTAPMLENMVRTRQVTYRSGFVVERVDEKSGKAEVEGFDLPTGGKCRLTFDGVFLAAGPINTTRLLLQSKALYDQAVRLKESQKFVVPLFRRRGAETAIEHPSVTLASVFLETKLPSLSDHWIHIQIVPMNEMILRGIKLPGASRRMGQRLWNPILRRTMAAWCALHSDHSSHVEVRLRENGGSAAPGRLELNLHVSPEARVAARRAARHIFSQGLMFGTLFGYPMIRFSNPGSGTHCGSSFPMKAQPRDLLDSDRLGRPFGWSRIFAVDSSVLPSIPATTLAFAAMANGYRIGSLAPL